MPLPVVFSQRTVEATLLASFAVLAVCLAGWTETPSNNEGNGSMEGAEAVMGSTASMPFPGTGWLDRMAMKPDATLTMADGTAYPSAYSAILYNDPLGNPCRNFNAWVNSIFFSDQVAAWFILKLNSIEIAHYLLCYLRNFIGAMVVYYGTASVFHYFCYVHPMSKKVYEAQGRTRPKWDVIKNQIQLSQASLTIYTMLPVLDEFLVESGWTKVYHTIEEIGGWPSHIATMLLYFACVEVGIYWMHRTLHTNKFLYKHVHLKHHQYKSAETLTPWASIAFHPLDGMLQASPYVLMLPFVPCHYLTHFGLLFFTAIWATYIHDAMDWNIDPVMGSKYHTVHHTHYIYNYGQVFIFCDWFWGTLRLPEGPTGVYNRKKKAA